VSGEDRYGDLGLWFPCRLSPCALGVQTLISKLV
jgi:hypothetical protein